MNYVSVNEIGGIGWVSTSETQPVLQGSQWADPAGKLHEGPPEGRGNVEQCPEPFMQDKQPAEDDKQDKKEMDDNDKIGKQ